MTSGPWFLDKFAGSWRFEEVGAGRARVGFRYSLRTRPVWLSWILSPILARAFALDTRDRLVALKGGRRAARLVGERGVEWQMINDDARCKLAFLYSNLKL